MYNGWTNWETWVAVTWLDDVRNSSTDEIKAKVEDLMPEADGLLGDVRAGFLREVNFDEIAKSFAPEEYEEDDFPVDE